ncbi:MAG: MBL fold metallo-hydrolase [Alphaproteobacteria bacterium]
MTPDIQAFYDPATHTITYLVSDPATKRAAIIDPVLDYDPKTARIHTTSADKVLAHAAVHGLTVGYVLETHAHADHLTAAHHIREATGATVVIGKHIDEVQKIFGPLFNPDGGEPDVTVFDHLVEDGDHLPLGDLVISVMHTPGHTAADVTYLIENAAFVGDTIFMPDYGTARTDFPGGDARTLFRSIQKILALPPETRLFTGHDYRPDGGRTEPAWESTVAEQRVKNIHVHHGVYEAEFVQMRRDRDASLEAPVLILPSLQVNIRAGELPPAAANGKIYLQLPVNVLGG